MTVEIISWSISTKVWDRAGIKLATPGSAVRHASVARQGTDLAMRPGLFWNVLLKNVNIIYIYTMKKILTNQQPYFKTIANIRKKIY